MHHCLTLPEHSKRKQTGETSERQELIFLAFRGVVVPQNEAASQRKKLLLKIRNGKTVVLDNEYGFFIISKNRYSVNAVECNIFFYSLTSERLYSNASGYVLPSVVLSHLAERQKIKK